MNPRRVGREHLPPGVYVRGKKFYVRVSLNGCMSYGGTFPTAADAALEAERLATQRRRRLGIQMSYDWNIKQRPIRVRVLEAGKQRTIGPAVSSRGRGNGGSNLTEKAVIALGLRASIFEPISRGPGLNSVIAPTVEALMLGPRLGLCSSRIWLSHMHDPIAKDYDCTVGWVVQFQYPG